MNTNKKKGRLALKKKPAPAAGTQEVKISTQTTILSMFKKQRDRDEPSTTANIDKESGSEGDVIITGVTQEDVKLVAEIDTNEVNKTVKRSDSAESTVSKKKGRPSLAKKEKRGTTVLNSDCITAEEISSKQDLAKKDKKYNSKSSNEVSGYTGISSKSSGNRKRKSQDSNRPEPYKLRKHRTAPVYEIASESDSGDDANDNDKSELKIVSVVNHDIPSSGGSDFQDNSRKRKHKVSLKRSKTADDVLIVSPEKKSNRKKSNLHKDKPKHTNADTDDIDNNSTDKKHKQQQPEITSPGLSGMKHKNLKHNVTSQKNTHLAPDRKRKTSFPDINKHDISSGLKDEDTGEQTKKKQVNREKSQPVTPDQNENDVIDVIDVDSEKPEPKEFKQKTLQQLFKKRSLDGDTSKEAKPDNSENGGKGSASLKSKGKSKTNTKSGNKEDKGNLDQAADVNNKDDDADDEDDEEKSEEVVYKVPYYLENFRTILDSVLADKENARLFDEGDMAHVEAFNNLTEPSQKLYVRLFSRKLAWLPMGRLKYPEISPDIPSLVDELHAAGLLHMGDKLDDLGIVLKILAAPDLKTLAKTFHIINTGTKEKIIELLLKKSQRSSIATMFTGGAGHSTQKTMLSRALSYLGKVCRLEETARAVFIRLLMLFSLYHTNFDEESAGGGQNQLFQMLMANIGRVVYPSYTIDRQTPVFQDRAALVRFETALQFELEIQLQIEKSRWDHAYELYSQAKAVGASLKKDKKIRKWDSALPEFLRLYTASSVYTRIDSLGVEILQRQKRYREAVTLLQELIDQGLYCIHHRGHWYERLALNLDAHLKSQKKSLDVVKQGLSEPRVHTGRRLALYERAKKICEPPKSKFADQLAEIDHDPVLPTPEVTIEGMVITDANSMVTIEGMVISDATSMGMKYQFIMSGDTDQTTLCAVEELVLEHYKTHGYPEGLHAEGSIISNLFVLFFWDSLFMPVPDVFHGPFQTCPLDLHTPDFYKNRKPALDERVEWIQQADEEELISVVGETWEKHSGEMCQGISWERFSGPETHQGLVKCMGGKVIAGMLERFVKNPRHTRSGFPDLTLWNTETKALKICEVKGPNDRLSYKQILWIDYLLKLGVDAEVCYVKAVGSKRLKPQSSTS